MVKVEEVLQTSIIFEVNALSSLSDAEKKATGLS